MNNLLSGTQIGNYLVGDPIAAGGMGSIYRAYKPGSRDPFVIKVILTEFSTDEQFRKRFEREISLLQTLRHPHIIPISDFGEENGVLYFVMPFIRGYSLGNLLERQHFSPATAWLIFEPISQALTYAHAHHVIHRDLKPDNILVEMGKGGIEHGAHPFLADFGLSKPVNKTTMTQAGMSIGTPHYMSPEQVRAQTVTPRTDVYSIGIVMYEMLLGTLPFHSGNPDSIALQQVREMPPHPTVLSPDFPPAIEAVILRAMAKNPEDRFESVEAFSAAYWDAIQSLSLDERLHDYWITP